MKYLYLKYFNLSVAPSVPIGPIEVIDVQRNSITIKWKPPKEDGGSPLTGYLVEKREATRTSWSKVDITTKTELCCKNLIEKTEYYFRVFAENDYGRSPPLVTDGTTLAKSPFGKLKILKNI